MKKLFYWLSSLALLIGIIISCTKDNEDGGFVVDAPDGITFELSATGGTIGTPNAPLLTNIFWEQVGGSSSNNFKVETFQYVYEVTGGEGYFVNSDGIIDGEDEENNRSEETDVTADFIANETGSLEVDFRITKINDLTINEIENRHNIRIKPLKRTYIITPFDIGFSIDESLLEGQTYVVNDRIPLNLTIDVNDNKLLNEASYFLKYKLDGGSGELSQKNGDTFKPGDSIQLVAGITEFELEVATPSRPTIEFELLTKVPLLNRPSENYEQSDKVAMALTVISEEDNVGVTAVVVTPEQLAMIVDEQQALIATIEPENAIDKSVTWESEDTDVAIVNDDGVVTAVGIGETKISVKSKKNPEAFFEVPVKVGGLSDAKEIVSFTIPNQTGDSVIDSDNSTINLTVPFGTDLSNVTPVITFSPDATITPSGAQDFGSPVVYEVTAEDQTTKDWTVTVTVSEALNDVKEILTFTIPNQTGGSVIDSENATVNLTVPFGTELSNVTPVITISSDATITPSGAQDFGSPVVYEVTAEDQTTKDWTVTVTVSEALNDAKEILTFTIPNQTGDSVIDSENATVNLTVPFGTDLSNVTPVITISSDATITPSGAQDFGSPVVYEVTAEDQTTKDWTVTVTVSEALNDAKEILTFTIPNQTGDSVIDSENATVNLTVPFGTDLSNVTPVITFSPDATITPSGAQDFGSPVVYEVTAEDQTTKDWTVTVSVLPDDRNDAKEIESFTLPVQVGTTRFNAAERTVILDVPFETAITNLTPAITVSTGADYSPKGVRNFSTPVTYTVTAENGTTTEWTVTVNVLADDRSNAKEVVSFTIPGQQGATRYNAAARTIALDVPFGTAITNLIPNITVSDKADYSPKGARNFSSPVVYTVTAENETTKDWTVMINVLANTANDIISFSIPNQISSSINPATKAITVLMPSGTNLASLIPAITVSSGADYNPKGARNFTSNVSYTVIAQNGTAENWTVNVTVQFNSVTDVIIASPNPSTVPLIRTGEKLNITTIVNPGNATNPKVLLQANSASDPNYKGQVTVNGDGSVTGKSQSLARVIAYSEEKGINGPKDEIIIRVYQYPAGLNQSTRPGDYYSKPGETITISVSGQNNTGTQGAVVFEASRNRFGSVDKFVPVDYNGGGAINGSTTYTLPSNGFATFRFSITSKPDAAQADVVDIKIIGGDRTYTIPLSSKNKPRYGKF